MDRKEAEKEFIRNRLNRALADGALRTAFPEMQFERRRGKWISPKKYDGTDPRSPKKDKTYILDDSYWYIQENGEVNGKDYLQLYRDLHGCGHREALEALSKACGLTPPSDGDIREWEAYKKKQVGLEELARRMKADLHTQGGKAVMDYLTDVRMYSPEFIEWAGFGFVSPQTAKEVYPLLTYRDENGIEHGMKGGVGSIYLLAIPYRSGGYIQGFVFRTIMSGEEMKARGIGSKYMNGFVSATATKRYHLFGLTGLSFKGDTKKDRMLTMVEGELDALRASFAGIPNVVALSSGIVYSEALKEAHQRGVRSITLMLDREENEQKQEALEEKIKEALKEIAKVGKEPLEKIDAYVVTLPREVDENGFELEQKQDTDSFLRYHSPEELRDLWLMAPSGGKHLFDRIVRRYMTMSEDGFLSYRDSDALRREVIRLITSDLIHGEEKDHIKDLYHQTTGFVISKETIDEEVRKEDEAELRRQQKKATVDFFEKALQKAKDGDVDGALSDTAEKLQGLRSISKEAIIEEILRNPTKEEIDAEDAAENIGTPTDLFFRRQDGGRERLVLPAGALTYICAPTSHGKSRMLENLTLQVVGNGQEGDVLYFSLEEDRKAVRRELLSIFANVRLSENTIRTIAAYRRDGTMQYISAGVKDKDLQKFQTKEEEFMRLLTSGRLRVFYQGNDSDSFMDIIRGVARRTKVKAVFVDYVQLLHKRGKNKGKDSLSEICDELIRTSVETGLPIVLGAQVNRQMPSPVEMRSEYIAEASDVEKSANVVMMMWNSMAGILSKDSTYDTSPKKHDIEERGFHLGQQGTIYAVLTKNRGGEMGMDAVMRFDNNIGRIYSETDEAPASPMSPAQPQPKKDEGVQQVLFSQFANRGAAEVELEDEDEDEDEIPF